METTPGPSDAAKVMANAFCLVWCEIPNYMGLVPYPAADDAPLPDHVVKVKIDEPTDIR